MTATVFLSLLTVLEAVTAIVTEGIKKFLDGMNIRYASNIVVLIVAFIVGICGTALYYVNNQIPINALTSVYLALMGFTNWIGSMVGYDKVKQALLQIRESKLPENGTE